MLQRPLLWSPPSTAGWTVRNITNGGIYFLDDATDYVLVMPAFPITGLPTDPSHEALVTVKGGRNIVLIGGQIDVPAAVSTRLTAPYADGDTTLTVASTSGYPSQGPLNIGGYQFLYTGKSSTTFTGVTRAVFAYSNAMALPLPADTVVWTGEQNRGCLSFINVVGNIFVEGIYGSGDIVDFLRVNTASVGTTLTIQNCRADACLSHDGGAVYDGHADVLQGAAGPQTIRMDRVTGYTSGTGFINKSDAGNPPLSVIARDVNFVANERFPRGGGVVWDNAYGLTTTFDCQNCWATAPPDRPIVVTTSSDPSALDRQIRRGRPETDFCPLGAAGLGYVSPGYLT